MPFLKKALKDFLLRRDYVVNRPPGQFNVEAWKYKSLSKRGVGISSAIDGGAADGAWSKMFRSVFPDAKILCVEPREDAYLSLAKWASQEKGISVAQVLLGPDSKEVEFNDSGAQSSVLNFAGGREFGKRSISRMTSLDALVAEKSFQAPDLIKLDLQGYELSALEGATKCVKACKYIQIEVSLFQFQDNQPIFVDIVDYMEGIGFRLYDILALWQRPLDGALGQGDFLFVAKNSPLIKSNEWG